MIVTPHFPETSDSRDEFVASRAYINVVSHTLTLECGCVVYVSRNPNTAVTHSRVIEKQGSTCTTRHHEVGARLALWELLPDPTRRRDRVSDDEIEWEWV
jgi:hypothetical protein